MKNKNTPSEALSSNQTINDFHIIQWYRPYQVKRISDLAEIREFNWKLFSCIFLLCCLIPVKAAGKHFPVMLFLFWTRWFYYLWVAVDEILKRDQSNCRTLEPLHQVHENYFGNACERHLPAEKVRLVIWRLGAFPCCCKRVIKPGFHIVVSVVSVVSVVRKKFIAQI